MDTDPDPWTRIASRPAYDGWIRIHRDSFRLPDGRISEWDVLEQERTVAVVALTPGERTVVLFDQYRVGPDRVLAELPGGLVEPGEDVVDAGLRELREETGYRAEAAYHAGSEWSAASSTRRRNSVIAVGCVPAGPPDWDEFETGPIHELPVADLIDHLLSGELTDAGSAMRGLVSLAHDPDVPEPFVEARGVIRGLLARWED